MLLYVTSCGRIRYYFEEGKHLASEAGCDVVDRLQLSHQLKMFIKISMSQSRLVSRGPLEVLHPVCKQSNSEGSEAFQRMSSEEQELFPGKSSV